MRPGIVPHVRRVARHREDVAHALRVRAEQQSFEPHHGGVPGCHVRDRLDAGLALQPHSRHQRVHARPRHRVVVDIDEPDLPGGREPAGHGHEPVERAALRRVELDADDPFPLAEGPGERRLVRRRDGDGNGRSESTSLGGEERPTAAVERLADRRDLGGRRPAAAADDPGAERLGLHRELREVLRGRVGVHDPPSREGRDPDVRHRDERCVGALHQP